MKNLLLIFAATIALTPAYINAQKLTADCLSQDNSPVPKTTHRDLYNGQQKFTVDLLDAVRKATTNENVFFSPYSTYHALLLAYFGARNETEKELVKALHLDWATNKKHVALSYLHEKNSRARRANTTATEFESVDKIFFDKDINLSMCMKDIFNDELETKDFRHNSEQCRKDINEWIAKVTKNEIPEMLSPGDVTPQTQLLLANAAYFKGKWANQFDPKDTTNEIFYTSNNSSFVRMMHKRGTYNFVVDERLRAYILEMPYQTSNDAEKDSEISMIIILPPYSESLETVLSKLTPETLEMSLRETMPREVDVSLPKFEFEQTLELMPILRQMGINKLFQPNADLSGYSTDNALHFGDAKHVSKIKVDEEGSTASSATVLFSFRSARPVEPTEFNCNHPFLFLIYDNVSKAILFTGIYRDPQLQN